MDTQVFTIQVAVETEALSYDVIERIIQHVQAEFPNETVTIEGTFSLRAEFKPGGKMSIDEFLPQSVSGYDRERNCLKRAKIETVGQLLEWTEKDLIDKITNFGQKSLDTVQRRLAELGLPALQP